TAAGTPDNPGHSVAIIGYVLPTNGAGAPYYRVWNPWWNTTFYLSSTASTYNLGGVNYKWNQTWYNWRKSATAGTVDNSALNQPVKKENGSQQKVKVSNELIKPEFNQIFKNNFLFPISPKILSNQKVAEFGNTTEQFSFIDLTHWGYAFGTRTINGVSAPAFRLVRGNDSKAVSPITQNETQYKEEIDKLITDSQTILAGASMAILNAMLGLLVSVIATPTAGSIIYGLLTGLCDAAGAPDPKGLIAVVSDYISVTHKIEVLYNSSQGY
ncbi:MAG: hypothetical protein LBI13_00800, partial [Streptococcaceae bacterium]|nr:hypothetical protein [Streptococcaceae bacterium]